MHDMYACIYIYIRSNALKIQLSILNMSTRYHERPDDESRAERHTLLRGKRTKAADRERRTKTFHGRKHENLFSMRPAKGTEMAPRKMSRKRNDSQCRNMPSNRKCTKHSS